MRMGDFIEFIRRYRQMGRRTDRQTKLVLENSQQKIINMGTLKGSTPFHKNIKVIWHKKLNKLTEKIFVFSI